MIDAVAFTNTIGQNLLDLIYFAPSIIISLMSCNGERFIVVCVDASHSPPIKTNTNALVMKLSVSKATQETNKKNKNTVIICHVSNLKYTRQNSSNVFFLTSTSTFKFKILYSKSLLKIQTHQNMLEYHMLIL